MSVIFIKTNNAVKPDLSRNNTVKYFMSPLDDRVCGVINCRVIAGTVECFLSQEVGSGKVILVGEVG